MSEKTALYRHFDCDGNLLYVGISISHLIRLTQHRNKPWFNDICRIDIEYFQSREAASVAEMEAVKAEKPKYNIQYSNFRESSRVRSVENSIKKFVTNIMTRNSTNLIVEDKIYEEFAKCFCSKSHDLDYYEWYVNPSEINICGVNIDIRVYGAKYNFTLYMPMYDGELSLFSTFDQEMDNEYWSYFPEPLIINDNFTGNMFEIKYLLKEEEARYVGRSNEIAETIELFVRNIVKNKEKVDAVEFCKLSLLKEISENLFIDAVTEIEKELNS